MSTAARTREERQLIDELTAITGATATQAVVTALRRELDHARAKHHRRQTTDLAAAAERVSRHLNQLFVEHGDLLYGTDGLPQ